IDAYNFAKRLKSLNGLTPWEFIIKEWKSEPTLFKIQPDLYNMGLNIYAIGHPTLPKKVVFKIPNLGRTLSFRSCSMRG
ncbi:MAG: hypothetical protein K5780_02620, partial [Alphaproteobacteria bacterium]|nr:hypothetical protein [Alphaproteobacteria bacterium]